LTIIMALAWLFPLYWILATSLTAETATIAIPPTFVPLPPDLEAFTYIIQNSPIFRWYLNTILVALVITVFSILFSLMCAYALALLEFRGKTLINILLLLGFMIPFGAMVIPLFMLMNKFQLVDSYAGIILPQIATPLSVIVFRPIILESCSIFIFPSIGASFGRWPSSLSSAPGITSFGHLL
jgi:multiple sugar transport system permease protein